MGSELKVGERDGREKRSSFGLYFERVLRVGSGGGGDARWGSVSM